MSRVFILPHNQKWLVWLTTIILIIGGVGVRLVIIRHTNFDGLYGQDAFAYYDYGRDVRSALLDLRSPNPTFWPLGYPIILAVGFLLNGISPDTAQFLSVLAGALTGGIVFRLIYDYATRQLAWPFDSALVSGVVGSLLILLSGQMLQSSVVVMSDVPSVFWACFSAWSLLRYSWSGENSRQARRWLILASVALGMATITRWIFGLLIIPWGLAFFSLWPSNVNHSKSFGQAFPKVWKNVSFRKNFQRLLKLKWRDLGIAILPFILIVGLQLLHSRQNPTAFYDHQWLQTWDIHHATEADFINADGTFHYEQNLLQFYTQPLTNAYYLAPYLAIYLGVGVLGLIANYQRNLVLSIMLSGWLSLTFVFLVGIPYQNIRFSLAFFPPMVIVTALGWGYLWDFSGRVSKVKWLLQALLILSLTPPLQLGYQTGRNATDDLATRKAQDVGAIEWVTTQIDEDDAVVYSLNLHLMMQVYAADFTNRQIYYATPEILTTEFDPSQPTYLFLNNWAIRNQWQGKSPEIAVNWINAHFYMEHLGRYGNYHLWRVHPPPIGLNPPN